MGSLPTIPWCPHQLARAGSGGGRPAQLTESRVPRALPNHFSEQRAGIHMMVTFGKPHVKAEYTWWNYTPTTILNPWWLLTIIAKKPNYFSKPIMLRKQWVWHRVCVCKPQRAYGAGQDRGRKGRGNDQTTLVRAHPKPKHAGKFNNNWTITSWILPYRSEIQRRFISRFYFFPNRT